MSVAARTERRSSMHRPGSLLGAALALLFFGLLPTQALAMPIVEETFSLVGLLAPCNVNMNGSCVKTDVSGSWDPGQEFTIQYDMSDTTNGVAFEIPDFFINSLELPGDVDDVFKIMSPVAGTFHADGQMDLSFDLIIERDGDDSALFSFAMSTGDNIAPPCGGIPIPINVPGMGHDANTNMVSLVGNQCVNIAPGGQGVPDNRLFQVSLTGLLPAPAMDAIPEPGTFLLVMTGLVTIAARRRLV